MKICFQQCIGSDLCYPHCTTHVQHVMHMVSVGLGYLQIHIYVPKTTTGEEEKGILKCKTFTVAEKPHH